MPCTPSQPPPAVGGGWRDALQLLSAEIRGVIRRHPAAAPLLVSRKVMPARRLEQLDAYARLLMRAGFTVESQRDGRFTRYHVADPRVADLVVLARSMAVGNAAALAACAHIAPAPDGEAGR